jgi:hypothetical protein
MTFSDICVNILKIDQINFNKLLFYFFKFLSLLLSKIINQKNKEKLKPVNLKCHYIIILK